MKKKFNAVDIIILAAILLVAGVFVWRYAIAGRDGGGDDSPDNSPIQKVTMTFMNPEVSDDTIIIDGKRKINVGDDFVDRSSGVKIGVITGIDIRPSRSAVADMNGNFVETSHPYRRHVIITVEGEGSNPEDGGIKIEDWHGYVNIDFAVLVNDSAFWLRFYDFQLGAAALPEAGNG